MPLLQPDSWILDTHITYNGSPYSLKLYGNTWKLESIAPSDITKIAEQARKEHEQGHQHGPNCGCGHKE